MKLASPPKISRTPDDSRPQQQTTPQSPGQRTPRRAPLGFHGMPASERERTGARTEGGPRPRVSLPLTPVSPQSGQGERGGASNGAKSSKGITLFGHKIVGHRPFKPTDKTSPSFKLADLLPVKIQRAAASSASPVGARAQTAGAARAGAQGTASSISGRDSTRYTLKNGKTFPSLRSQPAAVQEAHLERYDPIRKLGLTDESVFYRTMEKSWLSKAGKGKQWTLGGNPNSIASISNHLALKPNPGLSPRIFPNLPQEAQDELKNNPAAKYFPVSMQAKDMETPTLNVAYGERAGQVASAYAKTADHVVVKMTLGDLRRAGGGEVFFDTSAASRGHEAQPLIVTLPQGKRIPVEII